MRHLRFKHFLSERKEFSKHGSETLLSVSEYFGVKPRLEAFGLEENISRAETLIGYRKVYAGDFVMNYMLAWKGAHGTSEHNGIVSPAYSVFKIDKSIIDERYLHHRTRSDDMKAFFKSRSKGIIESRLRLYPKTLLASFFSTPDIQTQREIADFLDKETARIDLLIDKKQQFNHLLQEQNQSDISSNFTSNNISKNPRLRYAIRMNPSQKSFHLPEDAIVSFVPMKDIKDGVGGLQLRQSEKFSELASGSYNFFANGDLLLAKVTPCFENGKKAIATGLDNGFGFATSEVFVIRPDIIQLNHDYLLYLLSSDHFRIAAMRSMTGAGGLKRISEESILNCVIPHTNIEKQMKIANHIARVVMPAKQLQEKVSESISKLEEYRTALITAAVTGQIDVKSHGKSGTIDRHLDNLDNIEQETQT